MKGVNMLVVLGIFLVIIIAMLMMGSKEKNHIGRGIIVVGRKPCESRVVRGPQVVYKGFGNMYT